MKLALFSLLSLCAGIIASGLDLREESRFITQTRKDTDAHFIKRWERIFDYMKYRKICKEIDEIKAEIEAKEEGQISL